MEKHTHPLCAFVVILFFCCSISAQNDIKIGEVVFVDLNVGLIPNDSARELYSVSNFVPRYIYLTLSISSSIDDPINFSQKCYLYVKKTKQILPLTFCCREIPTDGREQIKLYGKVTDKVLPHYQKMLISRLNRAQKLTAIQTYLKRNIQLRFCETDSQPPLFIPFQSIELMIEYSYFEKIEFLEKTCN